MSCCRASGPRFNKSRPQAAARCVNCLTSLRDEVKKAISEYSSNHPRKGSYHFTAEIKCACGWQNKIPVIFDKK